MKKLLSSLIVSSILLSPVMAEDLMISVNQIPLNSGLKKQYIGYKYDIQNVSGKDINIVNAQIDNGTNGAVAYNAIDNTHPIATTWAICGPVGLFTFGIGWAAGLLATPAVWIVSEKGKGKAKTESNSYSNVVSLGSIKNGENTTVNTLVPIGTKPQIKLTVQKEGTKDLVMINK
jgi:hypothetical protein